MSTESINLLSSQSEQLLKLQNIVRQAINEEKSIVEKLLNQPEEDSINSDDSNLDSNEPRTSKNRPKKSRVGNKSTTPKKNKEVNELSEPSETKDDFIELGLKQIYEQASSGEFFKKLFVFKDCSKMYCEKYHFFKSIRKFDFNRSDAIMPIAFTCKICQKELHAVIGESTNLNQHFKTHNEFRKKWLIYFQSKQQNCSPKIDDETLDPIRGIISANISLNALENENFARCLKMELRSVRTFRYDRLPSVFVMM